MSSKELNDSSLELAKRSNKYLVKAFAWAFGLGACLAAVLDNYGKSSNYSMMSRLIRSAAEEKETEEK